MSETEHIARMAEEVASEIFPALYWEKVPPINQNWACVKQLEHGREKTKTHPTDAVYRYLHPYTGKHTYIIFDFKSFADKSISPSSMGGATRQLGFTLDCAMVSSGWQELYVSDDDFDLQGCLFVYNHDNDYKRDLSKQIYSNLDEDFPNTWPQIQKNHEISILDPKTIVFLYSLQMDLNVSVVKKRLPEADYRGFYQPDKQIQYQKLAHNHHYKVPLLPDQATSETIILRYDIHKLDSQIQYESGKAGFIIYYRGSGENVDEFIYLIDSLFCYQIIDHSVKVEIKTLSPHKNAFPNLEKAKREYSLMVASSDLIASFIQERLEIVSISSLQRVVPTFFETELGMD